jgi:hypothetical protein
MDVSLITRLNKSAASRVLNPLWWAYRWADRHAVYRGERAFQQNSKRAVSEMRNVMMGPLMVGTGLTGGLGGLIAYVSDPTGGVAVGIIVAALVALCPSAMTIMFAWEIWWRIKKPREGKLTWKEVRHLVERGWLPTWILSLMLGAILYATRPTRL